MTPQDTTNKDSSQGFTIFSTEDANGLGMQAVSGEDYSRVVVIRYPSDTVLKWEGETAAI